MGHKIYNVHIIKTSEQFVSSSSHVLHVPAPPRPCQALALVYRVVADLCACYFVYVCVCVCACLCLLLCMCMSVHVCVSVRVSRFVQQIDFYSPSLYAASNCLSLLLLLLPFLRLRFRRRRRCLRRRSRRRCVYNQFRSSRGTQLGCCIIRIIFCNTSAFVCYLNLE